MKKGKFERIARTGLGLLVGASAFMGSNAYCQEKPIAWRGIPKNIDGTENYEWRAGQTYKLEIWADNTALEGKKTGTFYWKMGMPPSMQIMSSEFTNGTNSFFYGMDMDTTWSKIGADGRNLITTQPFYDPISGNTWHDGVANRRGSVAIYTIKVDDNARAGFANFTFDRMEARSNSTNGIMEFPKIAPKIAGVSVINSGNTKPVISLNSSWEDNYLVQVSAQAGETNVLEKTSDLQSWTPVSTNVGSFT